MTPLYLQQGWDCLILVNPFIQILDRTIDEIKGSGISSLNINKELSASLMPVLASERNRFTQNWLTDRLSLFNNNPVLCTYPDLMFDPSFDLDPLTLFRQAAKIVRIIVMWPGDFDHHTLSYAIPEHHHYRTWKISDFLLQQPVTIIKRL